jgi:hypothetical protein
MIKVKELSWFKHPCADLWRAECVVGIIEISGMVSPPVWTFKPYNGDEWEHGTSDSIEEAKEETQAYYDSIILELVTLV